MVFQNVASATEEDEDGDIVLSGNFKYSVSISSENTQTVCMQFVKQCVAS